MGTNFYFKSEDDEIELHVGKRSAAGYFCWDCGLSLCSAGHDAVHSGKTVFLDKCAVCGQAKQDEGLENSSAGRELGFNKNSPSKKTGVASCSSFSWAMSPGRFQDLSKAPNLHIEDEYGRTIDSFSEVLSECPIKFFGSIGKDFS